MATQASQPDKQDPAGPSLVQEFFALVGVFFSFFLLLSLVSAQLHPGNNWCGEIGAVAAQFLLGLTGWGSYLLVSLCLFLAISFFRQQLVFARLPQVCLGLTGAVISLCGLLATFSPPLDEQKNGGFLGKLVYETLASMAGLGGAVLIFLLVLLISLMLAWRFSPYNSVAVVHQHLRDRAREKSKRRQQLAEEKLSLEKNSVPVDAVLLVEPRNDSQSAAVMVAPVVKTMPVRKSGADEEEGDFQTVAPARGDWKLPPLSLLTKNEQEQETFDKDVYFKVSRLLEQKLKNFGVSGNVVGISPGPVVTTYEYAPAPGIKINKIVSLADDLALGLKARSVRVVGSVPGKSALGIEIPNETRQIVYIRDLLAAESYRKNSAKLTIALGLDVVGNIALGNLAKMPHLLIAGATGAGKSIGINTIIASILYNATPDEVRFLMIDPKRIELSGYEGIPHLLHPVVVDPRLASRALNWAVREMERRYRQLEDAKVKSFDSYNQQHDEKMPYIVIIVDELADLMMVASKDVETAIARLAQMARAAGIHLILATQRPSVDVLTGLIKANFPTRISFKVSSKIDSRTILDNSGAEHLLGAGDMLYLAPGSSNLQRIHGAYISEAETARIVDFLKSQGQSSYDSAMLEELEKDPEAESEESDGEYDERYDEAVEIVSESGQASISMLQRRLRVGYNRAARMIETMEKNGIVGPADGAKPREVLARRSYL